MTMMSLAAAIVFAPDNNCKAQALAAINQVCRIPTHLFMLVQYIRDISQDKAKPGKGFGKGVRRALMEYYTSRGGLELAVLVTKYKNREGWTHEDLISLLHINPANMKDDGGRLVLEWIMKKDKPERKIEANQAKGIMATTLPAKMERTEFLKRLMAIPTPAPRPETAKVTEGGREGEGEGEGEGKGEDKKVFEDPLVATARFLKALVELSKTGEKKDAVTAVAIMEQNKKIQREHLPTELLNTPQIWNTLLSGMGMTALVRNLGKLSQVGVASSKSQEIIRMLGDPKSVKESRIHPLQVLVGMKTYSQGKGDIGSMTWPVNSYITTALSTTFRQAFGNITPTGKRFMIGLDVSGSMGMCMCAGAKNITPREGSVAMAMMTLHAEGAQNVHIYGFSNTFYNFNGKIRPEMTIQDAIKATDVPFGATDCALPMTEALKMYTRSGVVIDVFCVYTDSETYAPTVHPQVALEEYRRVTGIDAKLIVVGMVANQLTIADPKDKNTLNLAGFDTSTPELISMFVRGAI
jgi:60 kDa SS-A/Ro ribonucleoprotein